MMVFVFILGMFSALSWATPTKSCFLPSVKTIKVPVYPDRVKSAEFNYSFQYFPPQKKGAPTIVVVPGGPGVGLISDWSDRGMQTTLKEMGLPEDAGLIFPDPRTVDCNAGDEVLFPDDALRTEYLANDLLSAIKSLKISNYVLYGHSYGSVLATVMASMAEKKEMPKPLSVVLTGVVGRWGKGLDTSVYLAQKIQWDLLKVQLPQDIMDRFKKDDYPLGYSGQIWGEIIESGLYYGRIMRGNKLIHPLKEALVLLSYRTRANNRRAMDLIKTFHDLSKSTAGDPKWSDRLFQVMDCAELTEIEPTQTISKGELIITGDECEGRERLIRPFDSADWPISSPVFYFAGTAEAVTHYEQARIHVQSQKSTNRYFVSVFGGSHNRMGLYYEDCKENLWKSIISNGQNFQETLMKCQASQLMIQEQSEVPLFEFFKTARL